MNAKAKGTRNEHRSRRVLEAAGYAVTRAAGKQLATVENDLAELRAAYRLAVKCDSKNSPRRRFVPNSDQTPRG